MIFHNLIEWASGISLLIVTATTCILLIYLLFTMTRFFEEALKREDSIKTIMKNKADQKEIIQEVPIGKNNMQIRVQKIKIWKWIGIAYVAAFAVWVLPLVLIPGLFLFILFKALTITVKITKRSLQS